MIGYGISLPIIPFFFQELTHKNVTAITNIAFQIGAITAVFAFMQMISAPFWGWLSDITGKRKNILLIGISGYAISLALTGLSSSVHWLYVTRMLNGLFSAAILPIAIAYIIDVVPKELRTKALAWHGTIVGLGVVAGPAIGAIFSNFVEKHPVHFKFITINSFSSVFFLASLLSVISLILAGIFLPGTISAKKNPHTHQDLLKKSLWGISLQKQILVILLIALLSQMALSLFEGTFVLHAQTIMEFSAVELGYVFMVCGLAMAFPQGTIVAGFIDRFSAVKLLPNGLIIMASGLALLMFSQTISIILVFVAILAFGMAIVIPSITVMISQHADQETGSVLGLLTGANSLGQTLGPLLGSLLFTLNIHLPYLLSALFLVLSAAYVGFNHRFLSDLSIHPNPSKFSVR